MMRPGTRFNDGSVNVCVVVIQLGGLKGKDHRDEARDKGKFNVGRVNVCVVAI
jgi:hypothetical protein